MPALVSQVRGRLKALLCDRSANVAVTFALVLIPVVGAVGVGLDYSRANSARTAMQNTLDSVALTLGKEALTLTTGNIQKEATTYFKAMFNRTEVSNIDIQAELKSAEDSILLTGTGLVDTTFARVIGFKQIKITTASTVVWGTNKKIEIALVLDNTGSMASYGKIEALRKASKDFIDAMKKVSKKTGDIRIAVVPFDTHVNIGPSYKTASWIDWSLMGAGGAGYGGGSNWNGANDYGETMTRGLTTIASTKTAGQAASSTASSPTTSTTRRRRVMRRRGIRPRIATLFLFCRLLATSMRPSRCSTR
jgi:Flp pilus assembly protein TadG